MVTVNTTYKNGLRPFLTLPMKEVETVEVQLLKALHAKSLYQHYMYYLCRRTQSLVYKILSPDCLATPNDYTGMISILLSERLEETLIAYKQRLLAIIGAMNQA